jgi:carbon-monoxide dehydrogenase catalytic subunit
MPFAFSGSKWINEKGLGAALGFHLLGLDSYHCIPAQIEGSPEVQAFFEVGTTEILCGRMVVRTDLVELGNVIVRELETRRHGLTLAA